MRLGDYELRFRHDSAIGVTQASLYGPGPAPIVTGMASVAMRWVRKPPDRKLQEELVTYEPKLLDQFSRRKGRVIAFTKLLHALTRALPVPQARQERTRLWEVYWRVMPQDRQPTA